MGWGKPPTPPSTISDKDWQALQDRALKANPKLCDSSSRESVARAKAGAEQYRKRGQS